MVNATVLRWCQRTDARAIELPFNANMRHFGFGFSSPALLEA